MNSGIWMPIETLITLAAGTRDQLQTALVDDTIHGDLVLSVQSMMCAWISYE